MPDHSSDALDVENDLTPARDYVAEPRAGDSSTHTLTRESAPSAKANGAPAVVLESPVAHAALTTTSNSALHKAVWQLAWPSVATMMLQTINGLLDMFFVGHLPNGTAALAATGVGGQIMFLLISLAMGISVGTTALVARFTGAEDRDGAVHAVGQSLTLSCVLGLIFGAVFYSARVAIVGLMLGSQVSQESAHLTVQFLNVVLLATVPMFLMNVFMATFRGLGDTRTPMVIQIAIIGTHISLNVVLIYGFKWGVVGAATALTTSIFVGTLAYLLALWKRSSLADALELKHLRLELEWAKRILRIGIPAAVQAVIRTLGLMGFTSLLARTLEAEAGVAALQIGMRAEAIAFMPGFGYSVAAAALVGQSLGARDPRRAERCGWASTGQAMVVMAVMATVFFVFAAPIAGLFTNAPTVQRLVTEYLRISAIAEPFLALGMVLTGALQGAGDTVRPTYITLLTFWLIRLPLAKWMMFGLHMEARGAWLAMSTTTIVGGIMTAALFYSGKWKKIKV